jgi:CheY-like chemotaxis protein
VSPHSIVSSTPSAFTALVVEPALVDAAFIASSLRAVGFDVTVTDNFQEARKLLTTQPPLVLVTEIRLGAFNGLHLAFHSRSLPPRRTIVTMSSHPDPVLQRDSEAAGATFVLKPVTARDLIAAVYRTATRKPGPDGSIEPIRPPFERRRGERRSIAQVIAAAERRAGDRRVGLAALMLRSVAMS